MHIDELIKRNYVRFTPKDSSIPSTVPQDLSKDEREACEKQVRDTKNYSLIEGGNGYAVQSFQHAAKSCDVIGEDIANTFDKNDCDDLVCLVYRKYIGELANIPDLSTQEPADALGELFYKIDEEDDLRPFLLKLRGDDNKLITMMENIVSCLQRGELCNQYAIFGICASNPAPANNVNRRLFADADADADDSFSFDLPARGRAESIDSTGSIESFGVGNLSPIGSIGSQDLSEMFNSPPSSQQEET